MPKPIINGSALPIKLPTDVDYDPIRGLIVTENWESAGDNLGGIASVYMGRNIAIRWKRSAVRSTLTATISGGQNGLPDNSTANWQLLANEIQKSIYEHPIALSVESSYPGTLDKVRRDFEALKRGDPVGSAPDSGALDTYNLLMGFLRRGTTHFSTGQFVLKRTYSVSNFYTGQLPGENLVECIIPTSELLTSLPIPPVLSQKISSIPIPPAHTNYAWGWRQLPSTVVTGAQNRAEVSTEWWFEEWSTILYLAV